MEKNIEIYYVKNINYVLKKQCNIYIMLWN